MEYDYSKLNGRIREICSTQSRFAKLMDLSERSISLKLNGKIPWTQVEMQKAIEILEIPLEEIQNYFFRFQVHKN